MLVEMDIVNTSEIERVRAGELYDEEEGTDHSNSAEGSPGDNRKKRAASNLITHKWKSNRVPYAFHAFISKSLS